jgi:hypothetical protein
MNCRCAADSEPSGGNSPGSSFRPGSVGVWRLPQVFSYAMRPASACAAVKMAGGAGGWPENGARQCHPFIHNAKP